MGTHAPVDQKHQYLVSGLATYGTLGRKVEAGKGFYGSGPSASEWASLMRPVPVPIRPRRKADRNHIRPDDKLFADTLYEDNPARSRAMADCPSVKKPAKPTIRALFLLPLLLTSYRQ